MPSQARFPNLRNAVNYINSPGLKIGLYSDVADRTSTGTLPGAKGHEQQDADSLVAWGVDYLKRDFCGGRGAIPLMGSSSATCFKIPLNL